MKVTRKKINSILERKILIGAVVSRRYLQELQLMYRKEYILIDVVNILLDWCFEYFKCYGEAPGIHIKDIYESQLFQQEDTTILEYIDNIIEDIDNEVKRVDKFNVDYLLDETCKFFEKRGLEVLINDIKTGLNSGDIAKAKAAFNDYKLPQRIQTGAIDVLNDKDRLQNAFESNVKPLFGLPGMLGKMMNPHLVRGGFIGVMGAEKSGKSYFLQELFMQANRQRCNVVVFDAGDMGEEDWIKRIGSYITKRPDSFYIKNYIDWPVADCKLNTRNSCRRSYRKNDIEMIGDYKEAVRNGYRECFCNYMDYVIHVKKIRVKVLDNWMDVYNQGQRWQRYSKRGLRLIVYPNDTLTLGGIYNELDILEYFDNFIPDIIVVDYADIMTCDEKEERQKQNKIWKGLRKISQERHCLVITATQTNASSYGKKNLGKKNFSEDKRKYGHVTRMYAINQTEEEERDDKVRISEIVARKGRKFVRQVTVQRCLDINRFLAISYIDNDKKSNDSNEEN